MDPRVPWDQQELSFTLYVGPNGSKWLKMSLKCLKMCLKCLKMSLKCLKMTKMRVVAHWTQKIDGRWTPPTVVCNGKFGLPGALKAPLFCPWRVFTHILHAF